MANNDSIRGATSVSFLGLLTLAFIVLKLVGVINWPWVWVLAPLWMSWALGIVIFTMLVIVAAFAEALK